MSKWMNSKTEIESGIKALLTKKNPGLIGLTAEFYQSFQQELIPIMFKLFKTVEKGNPPKLLL